jgi:hypothetical protein
MFEFDSQKVAPGKTLNNFNWRIHLSNFFLLKQTFFFSRGHGSQILPILATKIRVYGAKDKPNFYINKKRRNLKRNSILKESVFQTDQKRQTERVQKLLWENFSLKNS